MHGDVHELPVPGPVSLQQREQYAEVTEAGGYLIPLITARPDGRDRVVVVPAAVERTTESQPDQVGADHVGPWPVQAERAQVSDDQLRRVRAQVVGRDPECVPFGRPPPGDDDVSPAKQVPQLRHAVSRLVVDDNAALADVVEPEVQAGVGIALAGTGRCRPDVPGSQRPRAALP